jgi:hypothetical protein
VFVRPAGICTNDDDDQIFAGTARRYGANVAAGLRTACCANACTDDRRTDYYYADDCANNDSAGSGNANLCPT